MGNPYTSQSIVAWNADPPSDDGSAIAANQLEWQKLLDKVGTPLKNLAEAINTKSVNAHARRLGTTFELKATNYSIAAPGDQGKFFSVTGTRTITLPAVADAGDGFPVIIKNDGSGTVTVEGTASELIDGNTSFTLVANEWALLTTDGSTWTAAVHNLPITGSFTAAITGGTGGAITTFLYEIWGNLCTLHNSTTSNVVTSTSTSLTLPSLPAAVRPTSKVIVPTIVVDNGISGYNPGHARIGAAGTIITFGMGVPSSETGFTAAGTKGLPVGWSITYPLT